MRILNEKYLSTIDKNFPKDTFFRDLQKTFNSESPCDYPLESYLQGLARKLHQIYDECVIVLIDDLDLPNFKHLDSKIKGFINRWLRRTCNDNKHVYKVMITESKHDPEFFNVRLGLGLNYTHINYYKYKFSDPLSDEYLSSYHTFSKKDVNKIFGSLLTDEILKDCEIPDLLGHYNPEKILQHAKSLQVIWHLPKELDDLSVVPKEIKSGSEKLDEVKLSSVPRPSII